MTTAPLWKLQTAIIARLKADSGVTSLLPDGANGIYDHVPPDRKFPYIALGDFSCGREETQAGTGYVAETDILSFSRYRGGKELAALMDAVRTALHDADLAIDGHATILCREANAGTGLEPDGESRRGRQSFRIVFEALPA